MVQTGEDFGWGFHHLSMGLLLKIQENIAIAPVRPRSTTVGIQNYTLKRHIAVVALFLHIVTQSE